MRHASGPSWHPSKGLPPSQFGFSSNAVPMAQCPLSSMSARLGVDMQTNSLMDS